MMLRLVHAIILIRPTYLPIRLGYADEMTAGPKRAAAERLGPYRELEVACESGDCWLVGWDIVFDGKRSAQVIMTLCSLQRAAVEVGVRERRTVL